MQGALPSCLQKSFLIEKIQTDIIVQIFADRIVVFLSQLEGKIGTYLSTTIEESIIDGSTTFHISSLLGNRDDPLHNVYARQLAERIWKYNKSVNGGLSSCPPILLGIALPKSGKKQDIPVFHRILDLVVQMYAEATQLQ